MYTSILLVIVGCSLVLGFPVEESSSGSPSPWESSGHFQGDIKLAPMGKNGEKNEKLRWTNRTVYYTISPAFSADERKLILHCIHWYNRHTCMKFVPRVDEINYIDINNNETGCWSYVGMIGKNQTVNLGTNCVYQLGVFHELLHAIGFEHMMSSTERDDYVTVLFDNVQPDERYNFDKLSSDRITNFNVSYDYTSIMHYGQYAFTSNNNRTIVTKDPAYQDKIGTYDTPSKKDLKKISLMYKCKVKK